MSFLAPWALAIAALVVVPLFVHLRRRETNRRVAFPAIRYLSRASEATNRARRTGDLLLLAVRLALLLLLALAAAGLLIGRGGPEDHRPTDVALVLDNTASANRVLDEATLLEGSLERAGDLIAAAGQADRFWVLPAVGPPVAAGTAAGPARAALARVAASDGTAHLRAAVATASALLPVADGREREIVLLSDLQATGFASSGADGRPSASLPRLLVYRPPAMTQANGAVVSAELESGAIVPAGLPHTLVAEIDRFPAATGAQEPRTADREPGSEAEATGEPGSLTLRLEVDGETVGAAVGAWGGAVSFRLPALPPGPHRGRVEIDPAGLRSDDTRHFGFRVIPPPLVRHQGPRGSFVGLALETLRSAGRIGTGPERIRVVEGIRGSGDAGPEEVRSAEVTVFIPPLDPLDLPAFNQRLARERLPWRLRPDTLPGEINVRNEPGVPGLSGARVVSRYLLGADVFGRTSRTEGVPGDPSVLAATEDGLPWVVRHDAAGRRALLLLSPLAPEATSVPASPAMIPFLEMLLLRWGRGAVEEAAGAAGAAVMLPPWAARVRGPDGTTTPVEGGAPYRPFRAGAYEVLGRGSERTWVAANVPQAEFDLRSLDPAQLQELFPGREVEIAGPGPEEWRRALYHSRRGASVTPWLVALALVAMVGEAILAAPGPSRTGDRADEEEAG